MADYRWIMYLGQNAFPGGSLDLSRHPTLESAREHYRDYCVSVYNDECSATLYPYTEEDWNRAQDFGTDGTPFDYPSRIIERGPLGGIRTEDA